ncbi:MAG TPA: hypothetical protein VMZ53_23315 [Kofleriaceae bacterium]|nr:hypothetical protein [Kofleriaceae bacterium]
MTALVAGCGRVAFDPLSDGRAGDDAVTDGSSLTFCETVMPPPTFCADFDSSLDPMVGFSSALLMNGGRVSVSPMAFSGRGSLESAFDDPPTPGQYTTATLIYEAQAPVSSIALDYEVYFPARPTSGSHIESQDIAIATASGTFFYDLDIFPNAPDHFLQELSAGTFMVNNVNIPQVSTGVWHHVRMTLDLAAATHTFAIDGSTLSSGPTNFPLIPGVPRLEAGINYEINSPTGNKIYVDNLVLYWQ